ncbi:hypothetical protein N7495_009535 [Penicillium taxi]|uniref:uncharacterized protein n=1 Tax=Penicillium taxi TaxID=168475 RepID=UPI002545A840|nr:uncharacterized protein N7495_009535 [Penicillium taxi]KAJ5885025.1 hypothetical protein N7495_009535 [Penicillium taxi]
MTDIEQHTIHLPNRSATTKSTAVEDTEALSSEQSPPGADDAYEELAAVVVISAGKFSRRFKLEKYIFSQIDDYSESKVLIVEGVKPSWGRRILDTLEEHRTRSTWNAVSRKLTIKIRPRWIHDCIQQWWAETVTQMSVNGLMTDMERSQIGSFVGTTLKFESGPYQNSRKEPDLFVIPKLATDNLLTIVFEVGWLESFKDLKEDIDLLLKGGEGSTNAVVVVKWTKHRFTKRIRGFADVYVRNIYGDPALRQHEAIFPVSLVPSVPVLHFPVAHVPAPLVPTGSTHQMATRRGKRPPAPLRTPHQRPPPPPPPLPTGGSATPNFDS